MWSTESNKPNVWREKHYPPSKVVQIPPYRGGSGCKKGIVKNDAECKGGFGRENQEKLSSYEKKNLKQFEATLQLEQDPL